MGAWFFTVIIVALGAVGASTANFYKTSGSSVRQKSDEISSLSLIQMRLSFEYMAEAYARKVPDFTGTVNALQMRAGLPELGSISNGSYPPSWTLSRVSSGPFKICTPADGKALLALSANGKSMESLICGF